MTNDYFPRPRRETKIEAVDRIKRDHGFYEIEGSEHRKISPGDRRKIEEYLADHDAYFMPDMAQTIRGGGRGKAE